MSSICIKLVLSNMCMRYIIIFFFKQKTAYEVRISDWSSDVCSSDLQRQPVGGPLTSVVDRDFVESRDSWTPLIRNIGRWLLVGILGLIDVATIFVLFRWLIGPIEMMFRPDPTPAAVSGTLFEDRKSTRLNSSH